MFAPDSPSMYIQLIFCLQPWDPPLSRLTWIKRLFIVFLSLVFCFFKASFKRSLDLWFHCLIVCLLVLCYLQVGWLQQHRSNCDTRAPPSFPPHFPNHILSPLLQPPLFSPQISANLLFTQASLPYFSHIKAFSFLHCIWHLYSWFYILQQNWFRKRNIYITFKDIAPFLFNMNQCASHFAIMVEICTALLRLCL